MCCSLTVTQTTAEASLVRQVHRPCAGDRLYLHLFSWKPKAPYEANV